MPDTFMNVDSDVTMMRHPTDVPKSLRNLSPVLDAELEGQTSVGAPSGLGNVGWKVLDRRDLSVASCKCELCKVEIVRFLVISMEEHLNLVSPMIYFELLCRNLKPQNLSFLSNKGSLYYATDKNKDKEPSQLVATQPQCFYWSGLVPRKLQRLLQICVVLCACFSATLSLGPS